MLGHKRHRLSHTKCTLPSGLVVNVVSESTIMADLDLVG